MNGFLKNIKEVTDPSDWKNTKIPALYQLDSLQRCYICKEFLQAPVVTSCNHTFCSSCIRQHLMVKDSCPLCQSRQLESNLRRVVVLEEIVSCYASLRPFLLDFLLTSSEPNDDKKRTFSNISPSPPVSDDVVVLSSEEELHHVDKRAKLDTNEAQCPICQKVMDSTFLQNTHIDSCLKGKPINPPKDRKPVPKRKEISSFFKSKAKSPDVNDALKLNHEEFYFKDTARHNDRGHRLPKLDFSSLTLPKLKEKLASINLSTSGTRQQLELRYNQYYILFNSNLDSNHPVDVRILRLRLNQWESSHLAFTNGTITNLFTNKTANSLSNRSITDKRFLVKEWNMAYQQEFLELKKQALASVKSKSAFITKQENVSQTPAIEKNVSELESIDFSDSSLFVAEE